MAASSRAQPEDEDYFRHNIQGNALQLIYFLPTNFNASAYDSYNVMFKENMTHTALTPMGVYGNNFYYNTFSNILPVNT